MNSCPRQMRMLSMDLFSVPMMRQPVEHNLDDLCPCALDKGNAFTG